MHWTYRASDQGSDLAQGDILEPTPELRAVLEEVHPWFLHDKYLGFIVLTQSCDLVQGRGDPCKARHISIAPFRSAKQVISSLLPVLCDHIAGNMYIAESKGRLSSAVDKIINQNENSLGLFYLHPEPEFGIAEECIATMRVNVALQSRLHYSVLMQSRIGSLKNEFAMKLGWICGNLYSRVGVDDWQQPDRVTEAERLRADLVNLDDISWISSAKLRKQMSKGGLTFAGLTDDEISERVQQLVGKPFKDIALDAVSRICAAKGIEATLAQNIVRQLDSDPDFTRAMKPGNE